MNRSEYVAFLNTLPSPPHYSMPKVTMNPQVDDDDEEDVDEVPSNFKKLKLDQDKIITRVEKASTSIHLHPQPN
jgi:hypothetical protein